MTIVEEHRTEIRVQDTVYRIEVAAREGGGAAGEDRWVTVMVGGPSDVFAQCQDLFRCFARAVYHVGPCGSGFNDPERTDELAGKP